MNAVEFSTLHELQKIRTAVHTEHVQHMQTERNTETIQINSVHTCDLFNLEHVLELRFQTWSIDIWIPCLQGHCKVK